MFSFPFKARQHGSILIEVNLETTPLTYLTDFVLTGPAEKILPELVSMSWPEISLKNTLSSSHR
jgi:NAD-dependent SIR2 family protein deacetylase